MSNKLVRYQFCITVYKQLFILKSFYVTLFGIYRNSCKFSFFQGDSDIIFADLDHDGDGKINFDDFSFGFRDFLTPGSRRGSLQLGLMPYNNDNSEDLMEHPKMKTMEVNPILKTLMDINPKSSFKVVNYDLKGDSVLIHLTSDKKSLIFK